jgi:hypothetical protein
LETGGNPGQERFPFALLFEHGTPKLAKKVVNAIREKSTRRRDYAEVRYE